MKPRNYFINRIQRNLIGPGADNFGLPDAEEILINMPLQTYYSAVLFPESQEPNELGFADTIQAQITIDDDEKAEDESSEIVHESEPNEEKQQHKQFDAKENSEKTYTQANSYFPTNFGLTFCVPKSVNTVSVQFVAGHYELVKELSERKVKIDKDRYSVYKDDVEIALPKKEFKLLSLLVSKPGKVFTREFILEQVWGDEVVVGDRTIDVHIRKLREKLGDHYIKTIKGIGYKFEF